MAAVGISFASDKKDLSERYKDKYLVVMRDGLVLAICSEKPGATAYFQVRVTESGVDTSKHGFLENLPEGRYDPVCGATPEPVHKGEVLRSSRAGVRGKWLHIVVESLSSHSVTRGVGAFEHESHEYPSAILMFATGGGYDQARALIDRWLKTFDTQEEAAKFGNTASGAFVKEVKLGMTPAEVEAALGLPETKVDLGEKVLYKYKNMTVEFHDGKVTDVK
jgi:hypothetical protein